MGSLQRVIAQLLDRLRDTNTSQKMALMLGGVLVAVSLLWLAQWAATPEMVPLLNQDLTSDELTAIQSELETLGQKSEVRGTRLYVQSGANRASLMAHLQQRDKMPSNTSSTFASLVAESDPWISQAENERRWTYALQQEIQQVLRQFQGVRDARVFLNLNTQRGFSRRAARKSASVTLIMQQSGPVPRELGIAAARLVSGAVSGLRVQDVQVVDASGSPAVDWEAENDPADRLARTVVREERRYREKIRSQVPDPRALVDVQAEIETTARNTETEEPLKPVEVAVESIRETTTRIRRSEQPGVQPNTGVAVSGGGADEAHEKEESKTELTPGISRKQEQTPAGEVKAVTAAISLSYTYLANVFERANPDVESPTEEDIERVFGRERDRLLPQVAKLVKPQVEENVAVSWYYDTAVVTPVESSPGILDETMGVVRSYGPQSVLALLAMMSLGVMLRMAKKSGAGEAFGLELGLSDEAIAAAQRAADDMGALAAEQRSAGAAARARGAAVGSNIPMYGADGKLVPGTAEVMPQAAATEGMLVAQEVDAGMVQTRKMLDQICEMTEGDPEVVAGLVEQWIQRNEQYREGAS